MIWESWSARKGDENCKDRREVLEAGKKPSQAGERALGRFPTKCVCVCSPGSCKQASKQDFSLLLLRWEGERFANTARRTRNASHGLAKLFSSFIKAQSAQIWFQKTHSSTRARINKSTRRVEQDYSLPPSQGCQGLDDPHLDRESIEDKRTALTLTLALSEPRPTPRTQQGPPSTPQLGTRC